MTLERGRPASSVDRAMQGWRREAIEYRDKAHTLERAVKFAETLLEKALEDAENPELPNRETAVQLLIMDALHVLYGTHLGDYK